MGTPPCEMHMRLILISVFTLCICGNAALGLEVLDEAAFANAARTRLLAEERVLTAEIQDEFTISYSTVDGHSQVWFLRNAYRDYLLRPNSLDSILALHVASSVPAVNVVGRETLLRSIVPLVRSLDYVAFAEGMDSSLGSPLVWESITDELVIVYGIDSPHEISTLRRSQFSSLGLGHDSLFVLALRNLKALLPEIECIDAGGAWQLIAGGNYEASLILLDDLWDSATLPVVSDVVVAVPARDIVVFADKTDAFGVARVREIAAMSDSVFSYSISNRTFTRKDGRWIVYTSE